MKKVVVRLLLAAAATLVVTLASNARGQQGNEDSHTASSQPQRQPGQQEAQAPSNESQTQDAHTFTGRVVQDNGQIVLKDPITKMSYQLDDQPKAKQFIGTLVKVTGRLGLDSNTIHIDTIVALQ
jgi:flagellar basal body-associated protein FliL